MPAPLSAYELRAMARNFVRRFGLPPHLAETMAKRSDLEALLERIHVFRHSEGQCLPPSCPLVAGFVRDELTGKCHTYPKKRKR